MSSLIMRRVRMADVASEAGVSRTTASFVLNGRDAAIPPETCERVQQAALRLGYRTNRIAQNLARRRTQLIGTSIPVVENPFFASLTAYLNHCVNSRGYRIIFEVTEGGANEEERRMAVEQLLDWRVDGLLLYSSEVYPHPVQDLVAGTPTVFIGTKPPDEASDCVYLDNYAGARAGVEYLISLGHRHFCHISPRSARGGARERALRDALSAAHLPDPVICTCQTESAADSHVAAFDIARSSTCPTAFVCHNDQMALGALRGLRDGGLRIPDDVSVIGYDDNWAAAYSEPPLTTVEFPYKQIVDHALDVLLKRMSGELTGRPCQLPISPSVVVRESTAPPRRTKEVEVASQCLSY